MLVDKFIVLYLFISSIFLASSYHNNMKIFSTSLFFALFFIVATRFKLSASQELRGSLTCADCDHHTQHFSDIKVLVTCSNMKTQAVATTKPDGSFTVQLPVDQARSTVRSRNCLARILGGPHQIYKKDKNTFSLIMRAHGTNTYTLATPLAFYKSCPASRSNDAVCGSNVDGSKTVDLPVPPEWGLPPSSYYAPFFPIIGIP